MHARSENLHDGARSAPEICDIFMNRRANSSYFHEAEFSAAGLGDRRRLAEKTSKTDEIILIIEFHSARALYESMKPANPLACKSGWALRAAHSAVRVETLSTTLGMWCTDYCAL